MKNRPILVILLASTGFVATALTTDLLSDTAHYLRDRFTTSQIDAVSCITEKNLYMIVMNNSKQLITASSTIIPFYFDNTPASIDDTSMATSSWKSAMNAGTTRSSNAIEVTLELYPDQYLIVDMNTTEPLSADVEVTYKDQLIHYSVSDCEYHNDWQEDAPKLNEFLYQFYNGTPIPPRKITID